MLSCILQPILRMNNNRKNRENTFRVEFGNLPKKPTSEEVHTFVGRQLGLTRAQLVKIQLSYSDECAFIKVTDLSIAQNVVETHDNKHDFEVKGVKHKIRIRMADGAVEVRLHDLSDNISDRQISNHLNTYGEVLSVQDLMWSDKHYFPGLASGIKLVKMILKQPIKSYIIIDGETTYVTYPKQRQTCKHCGEYMHTGISCVQNKKLLAQKVSVNDRLKQGSYADAVTRGASSSFAPPSFKEPEDIRHTNTETGHTFATGNSPDVIVEPEPSTSKGSREITSKVTRENGDTISTPDNINMDMDESSEDQECGNGHTHKTIICTDDGELEKLPTVRMDPSKETMTGKHKKDDESASDEANNFQDIKRARGRPKKVKPSNSQPSS